MTNRASFVLQQYRLTATEDQAVKDRFPEARSMTLNSNLNKANAEILSVKVLEANDQAVTYELIVEGLILPDAFVGGIPTYIPDFPKFRTDGRTMKMVSFTCDLEEGHSTIRIRG